MKKPDIHYYFGMIQGTVSSCKKYKLISEEQCINKIDAAIKEYNEKWEIYFEELKESQKSKEEEILEDTTDLEDKLNEAFKI